jgi:hypothetical protein
MAAGELETALEKKQGQLNEARRRRRNLETMVKWYSDRSADTR